MWKRSLTLNFKHLGVCCLQKQCIKLTHLLTIILHYVNNVLLQMLLIDPTPIRELVYPFVNVGKTFYQIYVYHLDIISGINFELFLLKWSILVVSLNYIIDFSIRIQILEKLALFALQTNTYIITSSWRIHILGPCRKRLSCQGYFNN